MSTRALPAATDRWWSTRRSRVVLVAVHVPFLIVAPLFSVAGVFDPPRSAWLVVPLAVAIGALQLRHSFAAARAAVPRFWALTLTALGLLVFVPLLWFGVDWGGMQWMFVASAAMLLSGRFRAVLVVGPPLATGLTTAVQSQSSSHEPLPVALYLLVFWVTGLLGGAFCIYGASQLVRAVDELFATRAEMATSAVGRERVRLSRDLHDLLGQSLSAVSLKGDLAIALLHSNAHKAAEDEIRGLIQVARQALRDMRHVVRGDRPVSLDAETKGAAVLLAAASIGAQIDVEAGNLPRPVDELLGWAAREGVTNMLRHSQAAHCSIRTSRKNGGVELEIINDGATPSRMIGTGIAGLTERADALSGSVTATYIEGGRFRLLVHVPGDIR